MAPRTLPHSEEAERAVLGGLLLDPALLVDVRARLVAADFYAERHQILYAAMLAVADAGSTVDRLTLQAHLEQAGSFDDVGGLGYLVTLDQDLPDLGRLDEYVEIVRERATRRKLITSARQAITAAADTADPVNEVLSGLRGKAEALLSTAVRSRWSGVGGAIDRVVQAIEEGNGAHLQGMPTGFGDYDREFGGLLPGTLVILAGRPGMGKTSLALDIVRHTAVVRGLPVGLFSLEMSLDELALKLLSAESEVPSNYLRVGHISQRQWSAVWQATSRLSAAPLLIDDQPDLRLADLEGRARRLLSEHPTLALVVVDYLQLVRAGEKTENRRQEVGLVARRLKSLARNLGIPVVALSQLNRENTRRSDPRPNVGDLAESGEIEAHCDAVAFVHRPEYYEPENDEVRGLAEVILPKNRHFPCGSIELTWLAPLTSFRTRVAVEPPKGADPF